MAPRANRRDDRVVVHRERSHAERQMDPAAEFATEARAFERWLLFGTDREADAARECLIRLLDLYRLGIELPPEWPDALDATGRWTFSAVDTTRDPPSSALTDATSLVS